MDGGYSPPAPVPRLPPPRTGPAAGDRTAAVLAHVVAVMAEAVGRPDAEIDTAAPLAGFGLDSLLTVGVTNRLKADFPELRDTELFEQQSLDSLARHLLAAFPGRAGALAAPEVATAVPGNGGSVPVAVIGMAGRYPGAPDLDRFWRNLRDGVGSIREVAPERWSAADFTDPSRPDRATVRTGPAGATGTTVTVKTIGPRGRHTGRATRAADAAVATAAAVGARGAVDAQAAVGAPGTGSAIAADPGRATGAAVSGRARGRRATGTAFATGATVGAVQTRQRRGGKAITTGTAGAAVTGHARGRRAAGTTLTARATGHPG